MGHDEDRAVLHLFVTDWSGITPPCALTVAAMSQPVKRLVSFVDKCASGYASLMEESDGVWELADFIDREAKSLRELTLYLMSDGIARRTKPLEPPPTILNIPSTLQLWDLERLSGSTRLGWSGNRLRSGSRTSNRSRSPSWRAPEAAITECTLRYFRRVSWRISTRTYGSRLLERNVRSFLQVWER